MVLKLIKLYAKQNKWVKYFANTNDILKCCLHYFHMYSFLKTKCMLPDPTYRCCRKEFPKKMKIFD